jgi:hypothetical protein
VPDFVSSCRLGKCAQAAAGTRYGTAGNKLGKADLKGACSEAAVLWLRANPAGPQALTRVENTHGQGTALTLLAPQLGRAVYYMFKRPKACDLDQVLQG